VNNGESKSPILRSPTAEPLAPPRMYNDLHSTSSLRVRLKIGSKRTPLLLAKGETIDHIGAGPFREMAKFAMNGRLALRVTIHETNLERTSYHIYHGGRQMGFSLPRQHVHPSQTVAASISALPLAAFARNLRSFALSNTARMSWTADSVVLREFSVNGNRIEVAFKQTYPQAGIKRFNLSGEVMSYPGICNQEGGVYAEFGIRDCFGRLMRFRIRDNGFTCPSLQFPAGSSFKTVRLLSFDGFRLNVMYGSDRRRATVYLHPPSRQIYEVGRAVPSNGSLPDFVLLNCSRTLEIETRLTGRLEKDMLRYGSTYDFGRLGAEVSYVTGRYVLGLSDLVIEEPSSGGRDLFTWSGRAAMQTRLIRVRRSSSLPNAIRTELFKLVSKLKVDFTFHPEMRRGFAVLSFPTSDCTLRSLVLEVPRGHSN